MITEVTDYSENNDNKLNAKNVQPKTMRMVFLLAQMEENGNESDKFNGDLHLVSVSVVQLLK